jgi:hypothetical protein
MKPKLPFKTQAALLYLDAVFFLERTGSPTSSDAKILALCWLDFWIEHDTANTEKHKAIKKHLAKM